MRPLITILSIITAGSCFASEDTLNNEVIDFSSYLEKTIGHDWIVTKDLKSNKITLTAKFEVAIVNFSLTNPSDELPTIVHKKEVSLKELKDAAKLSEAIIIENKVITLELKDPLNSMEIKEMLLKKTKLFNAWRLDTHTKSSAGKAYTEYLKFKTPRYILSESNLYMNYWNDFGVILPVKSTYKFHDMEVSINNYFGGRILIKFP